MDKKELNIIIVDDNEQFRTRLRHFIESELYSTVIAEASTGSEFLALTNINRSDIILMDIVMDKMDGLESAQRILWQNSHLKIIAITMYSEKAYLQDLIEVGFKGCVFKHNIYNELPLAIEVVKNGKLYFPDNILFNLNS
jgi:Response regulator containing a CheY-like receiver domain and an HTH DNA-binding domain